MNNDILAKKLLLENIPPEFIWIYELTNGIISKDNRNAITTILNTEAYKIGFDIRIIAPDEMVTMDWQSKRINIQIDYNGYIKYIALG